MINVLKKLLFGRENSSLNLFLAMPVLAFVSVCCLCPSGRDEPQTCITSDGANLVWAGKDLLDIRLADGAVTPVEPTRYNKVLCMQNNEVIAIKEQSVYRNNAARYERTARWRTAPKSYRLADIESFQKTIGYIQNRYFVSSSRGFEERSYTSGKSTVRYNAYIHPQVFNLEDSTGGELKSHYLYRDKLGLPETILYETMSFYPLNLDDRGALLFGMRIGNERSISLLKINMFDGSLTRTGVTFSTSKEVRELKNLVADKTGKYLAFVYDEPVGNSYNTIVEVFNYETRQIVLTKTVSGISLMDKTPKPVFDETGTRLAILVEGLRYEPSGAVHDVTVFDLATGKEIAFINGEDFFKDPADVGLISFIGDDLVLTYEHPKKTLRDEVQRLCKVNLLTKQIVWDIKLP